MLGLLWRIGACDGINNTKQQKKEMQKDGQKALQIHVVSNFIDVCLMFYLLQVLEELVAVERRTTHTTLHDHTYSVIVKPYSTL